MLKYYTAIGALSGLALTVLCVLIYENSRLDRKAKWRFYRTYLVIALAMVAEWAGVILNGMPDWTRGIHVVVKCVDYILTPVAGVCFVYQVAPKSRLQRYLKWMLSANAVFEVVSAFTGWTFYLDAENFYHHGPLYPVYVAVYCSAIAAVLYEFWKYGKNYKKQNRSSLFGAIALPCVGILVQEVFELRTSYFCMIFASMLLFIHYSEFSQMDSDDHLSYQKKLLETDALTGLRSRYAYTQMLQEYEAMQNLPQDLVLLSVDLNGLKETNDTYGHLAGDELIRGAAACIDQTLSAYGTCYRTGGDEFVAILTADRAQVNVLKAALNETAKQWRGETMTELSFSVGAGFSVEHPGISMDKLIVVADRAMYADKQAYYERQGKDRRKRPSEES